MRILVIEDDKNLANALKTNLKSESFSVDLAGDGESGAYLALTENYDLIILDKILPQKDGLDICKEIRDQNKNTPILALSVQSDIPSKINLLNAGADDYLTKPFSFSELIARIKALLRRPQNLEKTALTIGNLTLDEQAQTVFCNDKEIYLSRKEFMLLRYLMKNKGMLVSRAAIMEHVWDKSTDPFSNTIETHIAKLRKKINVNQKPKNKNIISTIPGRGYKIEAV